MSKYQEFDYVETKKGLGQIERIWELNEMITVFEVWLIKEHKLVNMYYGDIVKEINNEFYEYEEAEYEFWNK